MSVVRILKKKGKSARARPCPFVTKERAYDRLFFFLPSTKSACRTCAKIVCESARYLVSGPTERSETRRERLKKRRGFVFSLFLFFFFRRPTCCLFLRAGCSDVLFLVGACPNFLVLVVPADGIHHGSKHVLAHPESRGSRKQMSTDRKRKRRTSLHPPP